MKKSYFLKEKTSASSKKIGIFLLKALVRLYKFVFAKRTILFVTNKKIRTLTLGPILQACLIIALVLVGNLFVQTLRYDQLVDAKSNEIDKLQTTNEYFDEEIQEMNEKLAKINQYLNALSGGSHEVKAQEHQFKQPKNFKEEDLSGEDEHTFKQIKDASQKLANIEAIAQHRIKKIEDAIALTGLNLGKLPQKILREKSAEALREISLNDKKRLAQGGPTSDKNSLEEIMSGKSQKEEELEKRLEKAKFTSEIDYLITLEKVATALPLSRPMKNYYISSGFGTRTDPITGRGAAHQGLDFVGVTKEKIISPSSGKVILAGKFSDYGNAVVIDHGFGITTRYGHLSEVKVKDGQRVRKGEVIALQGSTGRSTGQHLHYEVRYKNIPLNPKKFLEAGESLFNDEKTAKHANS
ncbi:MAG: M23 family metallopeptidase [Rickettsiales bacterium]|nr:M23 family metallopeptidase [Rickettsiales bacterium]